MGSGEWLPVKLDESRLALRCYQAKCIDAKTLHRSETTWDSPIGHYPHQHVCGFGHERDKIPECVMRGGSLRNRKMRFRFGCVDQVGKFDGILYKKYWNVISYQIPVAFVRIKLGREASDIARSVCRPPLPDHCGETDENRSAFPRLGKQGSARILGK